LIVTTLKSELHCQLLLPGFARGTLAASAAGPALRALLRHAQREIAGNAVDWLCRRFDVAPQQDIPAAPFAVLGDGLQPDGYWLCADPVSLVLHRDSFALAECTPALRMEQAQQLVEALNRHFAADGMCFHAADARRWYLNLAQRPDLRTHPLAQVMGRDIQPYLPQGSDGLKWHGLLNELQMLLHAHPVNADLEQGGEMPVNSVWLWGGGELVAGAPQPKLSIWADDALARGLAIAHQSRLAGLPSSARDWLRQAHDYGEHLVVHPRLPSMEPQQALERLENDWFAPLQDMLRKGHVARLTLHLAGDTVHSFTVTRTDLWKFWRRTRPLENYLG
jgi:hypothetical protein